MSHPREVALNSQPAPTTVGRTGLDHASVTVYVVNRNYGRFLSQAVDSVLAQDHPAIDLIVVDDASDDGSEEILRRFVDDPRIRVIRHDTNRGLTASCNAALRLARGDYVMRLDADDYLHPSAVGKLAAALHADPAAVLVFPDYVEVDTRGAVIRRVQRHDFSAFDALSDLPAHGACTLARRTFLERIGGYDEAIPCQDGLDVWLHVGAEDRVLQIPEPLFSYRQHGGNLTRNQRALLRARTRLFAKHVAKRGLPPSRALAVVPVRGQVVEPGSLPLRMLGERCLIDWTLDEAVACPSIARVVVSSPDGAVLEHVGRRHGERVARHLRSLDLAGLNVPLTDTLRDVLRVEADAGRRYDSVLVLSVESPFRSRMFMQQAIDVGRLFGTDGVVGVRHEDEAFYRHDGLGLEPVRGDDRLRLERDDLFRACGGLRLVRLPADEPGDGYLDGLHRPPSRLGHVILDQLAAISLRSALDWEIASHLVGVATEECRRG